MPAETAADWTKFWELIKDIKFAMFTAHAAMAICIRGR